MRPSLTSPSPSSFVPLPRPSVWVELIPSPPPALSLQYGSSLPSMDYTNPSPGNQHQDCHGTPSCPSPSFFYLDTVTKKSSRYPLQPPEQQSTVQPQSPALAPQQHLHPTVPRLVLSWHGTLHRRYFLLSPRHCVRLLRLLRSFRLLFLISRVLVSRGTLLLRMSPYLPYISFSTRNSC